PEIIKLSPLLPLLQAQFDHVLVHSGQHYSYELDARFFEELSLPAPDHTLGAGSGSHGAQTARMLAALEPIIQRERPDALLVQGDTNTTLAGALTAAKLHVPVVHVEAGCRSFNRAMPEELNRVLVDHMADLLFTPTDDAEQNLRAEGIGAERSYLVGSTAIDACERNRSFAARSAILDQLELVAGSYLVLTLHRAENTEPAVLPGIMRALAELAAQQPIIFPLHPRTEAALQAQQLTLPEGVVRTAPLGYLDMLRLLGSAKALLTDSGGLQEEAAALRVPALVLRRETEWHELVQAGMHTLAGNNYESIMQAADCALRPENLRVARERPLALRRGASDQICSVLAGALRATEPLLARAR
ncbi:MAG: UDP-N-acetylglucosamine 2-epimerase (non-hydrolyzing), partial [Chloroflexales bacterium]|nr:UDP-N-acetylglucosamine 2-epimerase (non-hydrolyzing) [Chloroflexales bacterium]